MSTPPEKSQPPRIRALLKRAEEEGVLPLGTRDRAPDKRPVPLSEAARRFKQLERGPSRTTLSRDATAGLLKGCRQADADRARPLYRFEDLCVFYGVDPRPTAKRIGARSRKSPASAPAPAHAPPQPVAPVELPPASAAEITEMRAELGGLIDLVGGFAQEMANLRSTIIGAARDLVDVRKTLQLKYDTENGLLRGKADSAEQRLRDAGSLDTLSRELSATRQAVNRLTTAAEERWGPNGQ